MNSYSIDLNLTNQEEENKQYSDISSKVQNSLFEEDFSPMSLFRFLCLESVINILITDNDEADHIGPADSSHSF